jgi:hypothetical protein
VKAAVLLLLLSLPVHGEPVKMMLEAGAPSPVRGCLIDEPTCVSVGRELVSLRTENLALRERPAATPWQVVAAALLGLLVGAGAGWVVAQK